MVLRWSSENFLVLIAICLIGFWRQASPAFPGTILRPPPPVMTAPKKQGVFGSNSRDKIAPVGQDLFVVKKKQFSVEHIAGIWKSGDFGTPVSELYWQHGISE